MNIRDNQILLCTAAYSVELLASSLDNQVTILVNILEGSLSNAIYTNLLGNHFPAIRPTICKRVGC